MLGRAHPNTLALGPLLGVRRALSCVLVGACVAIAVPTSATPAKDAYELRAAILYNLSLFVSWRDDAFATPQAPVVIGILGRDPFGVHLVEAVTGRTTNDDRPLEVVPIESVEQLERCHMVFVTAQAEHEHAEWIERLDTAHVMLVGETTEFVREGGGAFALILEGSRIRIHLNKAEADEADLTIRAQLLRLCEMVEPQSSR